MGNRRAAQGVIGLAKTYSAKRLELACRRDMAHNSPYFRTVKTILSSNSERLPMPEQSITPTFAKARFVHGDKPLHRQSSIRRVHTIRQLV